MTRFYGPFGGCEDARSRRVLHEACRRDIAEMALFVAENILQAVHIRYRDEAEYATTLGIAGVHDTKVSLGLEQGEHFIEITLGFYLGMTLSRLTASTNKDRYLRFRSCQHTSFTEMLERRVLVHNGGARLLDIVGEELGSVEFVFDDDERLRKRLSAIGMLALHSQRRAFPVDPSSRLILRLPDEVQRRVILFL